MTEPTAAHGRGPFGLHQRQLLRLVAFLTFCGVCAAIIAPKFVAILFSLSIVLPAAWIAIAEGSLPALDVSPALALLVAFAAYLGVNATWSADPAAAGWIVTRHLLFTFVFLYTVTLLDRADAEMLEAMRRAFLWAMAIMAAVLLFEVATAMSLRRAMNNAFPFTRDTDTKEMTIVADKVMAIKSYMTNRNVAVTCLLFWPALCASRLDDSKSWQPALRLVVAAVIVTAAALSIHESSKVAMLLGAVTFAMAHLSRKWSWRLILVSWAAATLFAVPIAIQLKSSRLVASLPLEFSVRHRVVIWGYTAEKVLSNPWFGVGVGATKAIDEFEAARAVIDKDSNIPLKPDAHAHNIYLQAWYETGAVGAFLLLLTGLAPLYWIIKVHDDDYPYALATFALGATMATFSYSLTAPWFLAALGFSAVFLRLGVESAERRRRTASIQARGPVIGW
jgi:hypothetical protein